MHVVNVAVDDLVFDSSAYESALTDATPEVRTNLCQITAVGGLCNAATFGADRGNGSERAIAGDATGQNRNPVLHNDTPLMAVSQMPQSFGSRMACFRQIRCAVSGKRFSRSTLTRRYGINTLLPVSGAELYVE